MLQDKDIVNPKNENKKRHKSAILKDNKNISGKYYWSMPRTLYKV